MPSTINPSPLLVPWSRRGSTIILLPLWAVRPVQSLSACARVHFNLPTINHCHYKSKSQIQLQNNSFNPRPNNLGILIIQHFRTAVPSIKQAHFRDMFHKGFQDFLCISHCGISWPLVSYSINFSSYKDSRKHRGGCWWPWTSRQRRYPKWLLFWIVVQPQVLQQEQKITGKNFGQDRYHLIIQNIW